MKRQARIPKPEGARESSMAAYEYMQLEICSTIEATRLCSVKVIQTRGGTLRVLFTVADDLLPAWHDYLRRLVPALQRLWCNASIGQTCMMAGERLVAPWMLQVDTPDLSALRAAVQEVRIAFMRVVNPAVDLPGPEWCERMWDQMQEERALGVSQCEQLDEEVQ